MDLGIIIFVALVAARWESNLINLRLLAPLAMLAAALCALQVRIEAPGSNVIGLVVGAVAGSELAFRGLKQNRADLIPLTLTNLLGSIAALILGFVVIGSHPGSNSLFGFSPAAAMCALAAGISISASVLIYGKLKASPLWARGVSFPNRQWISLGVIASFLALVWLLAHYPFVSVYCLIVLLGLLAGVLLVLPADAGDGPALLALANGFCGLAILAVGIVMADVYIFFSGVFAISSFWFVYKRFGSANRSLVSFLFGDAKPSVDIKRAARTDSSVKTLTAREVAPMLTEARRVVIVPGYGMAAAQAQNAVRALGELLSRRGIDVEYGIHPVAGRSPGQMNMLLAEAGVPNDKQKNPDEINPTFSRTDVALVIGASSVVNPSARADADENDLAGMTILDVDHARKVIAINRSAGPGYAGQANPLFTSDNVYMVLGDSKASVIDLIKALEAA